MDATIATIIAAAAPLLFVTAGETISEKSGVINLSLEGSLMLAALAGFEVPEATTVLLCEETAVGWDHPLSIEQLCPLLTVYTEDGWQGAGS